MTKQELEQKVINAEAAVEKRKETLRKHREQLAKKIKNGASSFDIEIKKSDIESAEKKLEEAKQILRNWQDKLGECVSRDAFIEANAPQVIKDFLENWKQNAIKYFTQHCEDYIALRKELRDKERAARLEALATLPELERARVIYKDREPTDSDLLNIWPRQPVEDFLKARRLDYHSIRETLAAHTDGITSRLVEIRDDAERAEWLDKAIEDEKKAKLVDLIIRINKVVGTITDASFLRIGAKGDINGYVVGTEGRAKVETIGAGGYNIVCFHFRTLIHEYK